MDFLAANDKDFFAALKRSNNNLDELFGIGESPAGKYNTQNNENPTLKYQPPKQNSSGAKSATTSTAWRTLTVKFVFAYKNDQQFGKLGIALLTTGATLKILAYKKKTDILATLTLKSEELGIRAEGKIFQQDAYTQFYDDNNVFWSFRFDCPEDEEEFMRALRNAGVEVQKNYAPNQVVVVGEAETEEIIREATPPTENIPKLSLVSRMAKIGGHQLPAAVGAAQSRDCTDSTDMEVIKPVVVPRQKPLTQELATQQLMPLNPLYAVSQPPMESQLVQMMLTENRVQNSELRMNMSKLDSKVESLLDRFESVRMRPSSTAQRMEHEDEILALEETILELKKENRKLKLRLESEESKRQQTDSDLQLEKLMVSMKDDLDSLKLKLSQDYEALIRDLVRKCVSMRNELDGAYSEKVRLQGKLDEERLEAEKQEALMSSQLDAMSNALQAKEKEFRQLQQEKQERKPNRSTQMEYTRMLESSMKFAMMDLYSTLMMQLTEMDPTMGPEKMISLIGRTMKLEIQKTYEELNKQLAGETNES